jgi:hypothetical protein
MIMQVIGFSIIGNAICYALLSVSPVLAGEMIVDTTIIYGPARSYQFNTCEIAFDGSQYLVVWTDERNHVAGGNRQTADIYGSRVTVNGDLVDSAGFPISCSEMNQQRPAVCCGDTMYFVVWVDERNGNYDIFGTRVLRDGTVLDSTGIAVAISSNEENGPAVAYDGTNFLVVWYDKRDGNYDIYGSRITQQGLVLDAGGFPISTHPAHSMRPAVTFAGTVYIVVWDDLRNGGLNSDIYACRVRPDGSVQDPDGFSVTNATNDQWMPQITSGDEYAFVVWMDTRSPNSGIYGARIADDSIVLDTAGIAVATSPPSTKWAPAVSFDGLNYLVVWDDGRNVTTDSDIYGARVTPSGVVLDPAGFAITTSIKAQEFPAVSSGGTKSLIGWQDRRNETYSLGAPDIYGSCVEQDGSVSNPEGMLLSMAPQGQISPTVACDGSNYLVVWHDERYDHDILGTRISQSGQIIDPCGIEISTAQDAQFDPAVTFGFGEYFVVWTDYGFNLWGARVSQDGTVQTCPLTASITLLFGTGFGAVELITMESFLILPVF